MALGMERNLLAPALAHHDGPPFRAYIILLLPSLPLPSGPGQVFPWETNQGRGAGALQVE